jgi:glutamate-5-semialdehyde dehydrogenase
MNTKVKKIGIAAKSATREMACASTQQKNRALEILVENLLCEKERLLQANRQDVLLAIENGLSSVLLERLSLENRMEGIIHDIKEVIRLSDPIGEFLEESSLANQLKLAKCRTPIGVLGVIYESRPNVTIDISALTIKSGNCAILRGGSETLHTNKVLVEIVQRALISAGLPKEAVQIIDTADRSEVHELLQMHEYVDLIIPRGGAALQQYCREQSLIPVITGGIGICHLFVDETADWKRSIEVILNAKTQRPTVCNALDTLLVHAAIAPFFVPQLIQILKATGVIFRLDAEALAYVQEDPSCHLAECKDWDTEWLSLVLGIKLVKTLDEAINHIQCHGTGHSDGILTESPQNADLFVRAVDSAAVYVNASTRFTDGGQFGLGAEVAISTQKLHARGPMGLKELTSCKWIIRGDYQVRK